MGTFLRCLLPAGLQGFYALTLRYAPARRPGDPSDVVDNDNFPEFLTALQEQLGLKLQSEKMRLPVLVVEHNDGR